MQASAKTCLFLLLSMLFCLTACKEIPPTLNLQEENTATGSTDLETQEKGVLIEEFTGVRCVNCPAGAEAIAQLKLLYGDRLIPISLHTGFFSNPYPENTIDFRNGDADAIETFLGGPQGYPSAIIDRTKFQGEQGLQLMRNSWAGYIGAQLNEEPGVAIGLELDYSADRGEVTVDVDILGRTGSDGREAYLTILLLENEVEDYQLTPEGKQADYVHEHVLRSAVTSPLGESLGIVSTGQTLERTLTAEVLAEYNPDHLDIVAFVHYADGAAGGKEVLQAVVKKVE